MFLIIASLLLLAVIAYQNYATPALRNETISDGLYPEVPSHWMLDTAYTVLAVALCCAFASVSPLSALLASLAAFALSITAISNTYYKWVDKVTGGKHAQIHTIATELMFLLIIALEIINNHGWLTWVTVAGIAGPVLIAALMTVSKTKLQAGPVAEKLAVVGLCAWFIAWSLA